jgi:hypothetical protein
MLRLFVTRKFALDSAALPRACLTTCETVIEEVCEDVAVLISAGDRNVGFGDRSVSGGDKDGVASLGTG